MSEFDFINRYFSELSAGATDSVALGIGDDAAVLNPPPGKQLVMATDVLNEGVHFPIDTDAADIGHKCLAVNLSDLAAMGATPLWCTLGLTLPAGDEAWIQSFSRGFGQLARRHNIALVGGDTTRGPLSLAVTVVGSVATGGAITRGGAKPGDRICVTGALGDAGLALASLNNAGPWSKDERATLRQSLDRPEPRVAAGLALAELASAGIDVSDGLAQDLAHITAMSQVGAEIDAHRVPLSSLYASRLTQLGYDIALGFGDDYELLVTIPEARLDEACAAVSATGCQLTEIGQIVAERGVRIRLADGKLWAGAKGYDHF